MDYQSNVSVVVCTKNSSATLGECLRSVQRIEPSEIIVVDGKSRDSTVETALEFTRDVYSDFGLGLGLARQLGLALSNGRCIAFIDSDVIIPHAFLRTMIDELEAGQSSESVLEPYEHHNSLLDLAGFGFPM